MASIASPARPKPASPDVMMPHLHLLTRTKMECEDTFTMELEPLDGEAMTPFRPGQFNMLYAFGVGEVPISVSGDPAKKGVLVHTTREVGLVTQALRRLQPGNVVGVRGPFGNWFPLEECEGKDIVLVAGGIGLAPLRPVIYHAVKHREKFGRFLLLYGTRTPEDILFAKELQRWRSSFDLEVYITVDRATANWRGNVGVVTKLISRAPFDPRETAAMVCGPEVMMRYSVQELAARGVDKASIYVSMERNMKCGVGHCGHCQLREEFICKDGPVYSFDVIEPSISVREL